MKPGDRVATFAWSTYRHLELYYAVPMIGAVLALRQHPALPGAGRLGARSRGETGSSSCDASLAESAREGDRDASSDAVAARDRDGRTLRARRAPSRPRSPVRSIYEELLAGRARRRMRGRRSTNGRPRRSATRRRPPEIRRASPTRIVRNSCTRSRSRRPTALNVRQRDVILPVVPMFHVNAWGLPFSALMMGAKLVFAGQKLDPASVIELIDGERVTMCAGVPTVWLPVRDELARSAARRCRRSKTVDHRRFGVPAESLRRPHRRWVSRSCTPGA